MNVALIGYGKMGHEIESVLISRGHTVKLIIDKNNISDFNAENVKGIDVAIEFSAPCAAYDNVAKSLRLGLPIVCGTTAWTDRLNEVKEICKEYDGAFFYASNYSIGVNLMFRVNRYLASMMERFAQYDVTVEETHHAQKVDAPSGTALTLIDDILDSVERKESWVLGASTNPTELNVAALRRSNVNGTHTVTWESNEDELTITHRAKSRAGFAAGAVAAAEFIVGKKGFYDMNNLLK